jgi:hypothetical protein
MFESRVPFVETIIGRPTVLLERRIMCPLVEHFWATASRSVCGRELGKQNPVEVGGNLEKLIGEPPGKDRERGRWPASIIHIADRPALGKRTVDTCDSAPCRLPTPGTRMQCSRWR